MRKMWDLLAVFVAMIYSIIIWFDFFGTGTFTISSVITVALAWIVGVVIIGFGAKIIGWLLDYVDAVMAKEVADLAAAE